MGKQRTRVKAMSPQQRAAAMISVRKQHGQRSQRAISMDARQTASRVYDPDTDNLHPWQNRPNRCDVEGVDTRMVAKKPTIAKSATVEKPEPKAKATKKDEMGREIVYERVSKYGKGIGWYQVVKLPDGEYGIHQIQLMDGKEQDAYAGRETSLNVAKETADRYMADREHWYGERISDHRAKLHKILTTNQIKLRAHHNMLLKMDEGAMASYNERAATSVDPAIASRYGELAEKHERKIANTKKKQQHQDKLWAQHEKKDKLYLYGNKKLVADARLVLKEDFGITDADADKLFTPNLKLEYSHATKFAGRCISSGKEGFPKIQISSVYHKNEDIKEDRKYRGTMIHELIHHMRLWELDRARFSTVAQHVILQTTYDKNKEEQRTVMETQLRGAPDYCDTARDSYYAYLKDLPPNAGEEDNKILTGSPIVKKVIPTKEIAEHMDKRGHETHISKLRLHGRTQWINRTQVTSEGDVVRTYDPKARKPNMREDARELDAEDGEVGEEDVYEIIQDGTKKLILKRRR